jgi:hypothetical protein
MPRKQRFKPNRKPTPAILGAPSTPGSKETQHPTSHPGSSSGAQADEHDEVIPRSPEALRREVHPDDVEVGEK